MAATCNFESAAFYKCNYKFQNILGPGRHKMNKTAGLIQIT